MLMPSMRLITGKGTFALTSHVAQVCRRSCQQASTVALRLQVNQVRLFSVLGRRTSLW
jgi:hypothetical protein